MLSKPLQLAKPAFAIALLLAATPAALADERTELLRCEKQICQSVNRSLTSGSLSCPIRKTWSEAELQKAAAKAGLDWSYGGAICSVRLKLPRKDLTDALTSKSAVLTFPEHVLSCTSDKGAQSQLANVTLAPTVQFQNGHANQTTFNVAKIDASYAVSGALWTAAGLHDNTSIFQEDLASEINKLLQVNCKKYK